MLDKKSVLFFRSQKGDCTWTWDIFCKKFKSFERPQLLNLLSELIKLKNNSNESTVEYLTRADDINFKLTLVNEEVSEKIFVSINLKGLPNKYETFITLLTLRKKDKSVGEITRELINFDNENLRVYSTIKKENVSIVKRSHT